MEQSIQNFVQLQITLSLGKFPETVRLALARYLVKFMRIDKIEEFMNQNREWKNFDFIAQALRYLNFSYGYREEELAKVPAKGGLICVANHPLGGLDAFALLHLIHQRRRDVKIVVNQILMQVSNLSELFLPLDVFSKKNLMQSIRNIELNLKSGRAIIFFPAGEVSRLSWAGIHDKAWQAGALFFAQKYDCPIIPFYVKGRNSALFYLFSLLSKKASVFLLPWEMLKQRNNSIHILIGKVQRAGELVKEDFEMSKGILKLREMTYALK